MTQRERAVSGNPERLRSAIRVADVTSADVPIPVTGASRSLWRLITGALFGMVLLVTSHQVYLRIAEGEQTSAVLDVAGSRRPRFAVYSSVMIAGMTYCQMKSSVSRYSSGLPLICEPSAVKTTTISNSGIK